MMKYRTRWILCLAAALVLPFALAGCGSTDTDEAALEDMESASQAASMDELTEFPDFSAMDLNGNAVTQEIFAEADITVVNIWATFCSPCIEEMPELAEWSEEMPENVQIIGIAADIEDASDGSTIAEAENIANEAGADYISLIPCDDLASLLHSIPGYPTTYFVDNDGNIVDQPVYGANVSTYRYIVEQYLDGAYDENGDLIDTAEADS